MKRLVVSMAFLFALAAALGLTANALNPRGIPLIGHYAASDSGTDSVIVPPSAEAGDPPFISLKEAYGKFNDPGTIFLDAREPEDYQAAHIRGAINLPFEQIDQYWPDVEPQLPKAGPIVIYCSGAECESSLHEGRFLKSQGYENLFVFFGGWAEWANHGFPVDSTQAR